MVMVDFTNAKIQVSPTSTNSPMAMSWECLNTDKLRDVNNTVICTNNHYTQLTNDKKKCVYSYTGTFTTSGTEFYISSYATSGYLWKVSNISFQAGDTYSFEIPITLVCN